jgi:hypothetical protein
VEPLPSLLSRPLLWNRHRCRGATAVLVIGTPLPSLLSCSRCLGAAIVVLEPSPLSWSRCHRKTKKKKTKTKKKKKKKKKTKTKKKKQLLRLHYNMS